MKTVLLKSIILFSILILLTSCSTGGSFLSMNATNVELSESNFNVVARNVEGKSNAAYVLGFTYSAGSISNTFALARVNGSSKLYDDAIQNLWNNYKAEYGDTEGKNLVLANIRIDNDMLNLFLYTETKLFVTADIIEFK
ncbi:MAG: hypothetical protein KDC88_09930 [Ignavibacteriae bacterium]|nr:hypothetical protein [Ignavibacteriota bacterium]MCB9208376.1 hypothetical protein [Ignavibacteriales bacterium]MCB9259139.1 hypothetical protein [Ignavibacteriales bacterium]